MRIANFNDNGDTVPKVSGKLWAQLRICSSACPYENFDDYISREKFFQQIDRRREIFYAPELLLFDEPTVGVDPLSRRELREIIKNSSRRKI